MLELSVAKLTLLVLLALSMDPEAAGRELAQLLSLSQTAGLCIN